MMAPASILELLKNNYLNNLEDLTLNPLHLQKYIFIKT